MSIKQLFESGGDLADVGKLVDPNFNKFGTQAETSSWGVMNFEEGDPNKPRPLTPGEMREWNMFLDYVKQRGYEGSEELNKRDKGLGAQLFSEFKQKNPNVSITYDIVPSVQEEMQKLKTTAQDFAKRHGQKNPESLMSGVSPVDGWFGSKTSQFRFPEMEMQHYHNEQLVQKQNLGLIDSSMQPTGGGTAAQKRALKPGELPGDAKPGAKLEKMADGRLYYENRDGDMVLYK